MCPDSLRDLGCTPYCHLQARDGMQTKSAIRAEYTTKLERQVKEITVEAGPISRSEAVFRSSLPNSALYQIQFAASFLPLSISLLLRAFSYASRLGCAS